MANTSGFKSFGWIAVGAAVFGVLAFFLRRFGWANFGFKTMVAAGEKWRDVRQAERVQSLISRPD